MYNIYFISGLGVDHRLFYKQYKDGINLKILQWKSPLANETLEAYAKRLSEEIKEKDNIILGGVSLGGIMAIEISKYINAEKIIIISSIKNQFELPPYLRILRHLPIHKLIPSLVYKKIGTIARSIYRVFGKMNKEEKDLFLSMVNDSDPNFIKWAIHAVITWKNKEILPNIIHLHGTDDLIFPISFIKQSIQIKDGSHFMIVTQAEKINKILKTELND